MYPRGSSFSGIFIKHQVESIEKLGVRVIKAVKRRRNPLGYFPFIFESICKILFYDYDIVHAHYVPHSAIVPAMMKWIKKKPLIVTFHGDDARIFPWKNRINRMLTMFVVNRSDRIIARSEEMKSILEKLGCPGKKIVVISAGVDTSLFHPIDKNKARADIGLPVDKHIVMYVGRLHEMKGVNDIYACAERMSEILFVMVGDGAIKTNVGNCIFAGAKKYDEIPAWMSGAKKYDEIPAWMSAADIMVLPSYSEGLPNVVMEALSCGTPAIVTDVGGCPEVVRDGETGFVVPVGDVDALVERITYCIGRMDMIERYDRAMLMDRLKAVYEQLCDTG
jgi:glycosyltransferase involved in cell wall biosynthesis